MHSFYLVCTGMHTHHREAGLAESQTAACDPTWGPGQGADLISPGVGAPHTDTVLSKTAFMEPTV